MKKVIIDPTLKGQHGVMVATRLLDEVLGNSAALVEAEWSQRQDERGRPLIALRVTDFTGAAETQFIPEELLDTPQLRDRLHWLWGDLLQDRSYKQLQRLRETVQQLGED